MTGKPRRSDVRIRRLGPAPDRPFPHSTSRWFGWSGPRTADAAAWSLALLESTLEATTDGILVVDRAGRILGCNRRFTELWRVPEGMIGPRGGPALLRHVRAQLARPHALLAAARAEWEDPALERVSLMECADGRVIERHAHAQRIDGQVVGRVWSFRDVTERRRLEVELLRRTQLDPLTGLANRTYFRERVEEALAQAAAGSEVVAVLFLDLDDFKRVNDSFGHAEGDELLQTVADRLRHATRGGDTIARLGGDEFAVLLRGVQDGAVTVAERITTSLGRPISLRGAEVAVGASVGIAVSRPGLSADTLLRNADVAMYEAKSRGKGRYAAFTPAMHAAVLVRLQLEGELRTAVAESQFEVHYQPVVRLDTRRTVGAEALVRWRHPERGLLLPGAFVPFAEQSGIVVDLGRLVLREACRTAAAWQRPDDPFHVSVNVSGRQLQDERLLDDVREALAESGLPPSSLSLEITESVIMQDTEATLARLHELKALGVRLAIDDFGTGYSSLGYLHRFPVDVLKIDKSFVDAVGAEGGEPLLARVVLSLGETLGLTAIAEGIEHERQVAGLRELGCQLGQGYHFARPLSAAELSARLA